MKHYFLVSLLVTFITFQALAQDSYLINNIHIVPMHQDTVLRNHTIWIHENQIKQIAPSIKVGNLRVIDGQGKYLMPGLIDMHVHLLDRIDLGLYLANGVTTIRNMMGLPWHLKIRKKLQKGKLLGPTLWTASPMLQGEKGHASHQVNINSVNKARRKVAKYYKKGYDFIKTYNGIPKKYFDAIIDEAKMYEIPIAAHPSFEVNYEYHFQKGIGSIEHTEDIVQQVFQYKLDTNGLSNIIQAYAKSGIPHCPTLSVYYRINEVLHEKNNELLRADYFQYANSFTKKADKGSMYDRWKTSLKKDSTLRDRIRKQHELHLLIINKLYLGGVRLICGTDAGVLFNPAGFSIHDELAFYTQAGLSNYEALKTATFHPSKAFQLLKEVGSIQEGKTANFIISHQNPLENMKTLRNPYAVIMKGRWLNHVTLEQFKKKGYDRHNYLPTLSRILRGLLVGK